MGGLDATLQLFTNDFKFFVPQIPIVMAASTCHDTAEAKLRKESCETQERLQKGFLKRIENWPIGYTLTYCNETHPDGKGGKVVLELDRDSVKRFGKGICPNITDHACCPWRIPPSIKL